jgi:hypothetical protein
MRLFVIATDAKIRIADYMDYADYADFFHLLRQVKSVKSLNPSHPCSELVIIWQQKWAINLCRISWTSYQLWGK